MAKQIRASVVLAVSTLLGCSRVAQPPGVPPTPTSINRHDPGGDAHDQHEAALERLLSERWGRQHDKFLKVPLPDYRQWTRTRFALVDHFTAFRYGDDHHALQSVFVRPAPTRARPTSRDCLVQHDEWMLPKLRSFGVVVTDLRTHEKEWFGRFVLVQSADAELDYGVGLTRLSVAWAAFDAYRDACLVTGIAVFQREHPQLARRVRDRWVEESPRRMGFVSTVTPPFDD